jgi:hypothetical protein
MQAVSWSRQGSAELTTIADHNDIGQGQICPGMTGGDSPADRRFPTARAYLTSEGSIETDVVDV